jgi:hypothetical protein
VAEGSSAAQFANCDQFRPKEAGLTSGFFPREQSLVDHHLKLVDRDPENCGRVPDAEEVVERFVHRGSLLTRSSFQNRTAHGARRVVEAGQPSHSVRLSRHI